MAEKKIAAEEACKSATRQEIEQDEVDEVLSVLRRLYQKVTSPIIKSCLEASRADIAFLADTGEVSLGGNELAEDDFEEELDNPEADAAAA